MLLSELLITHARGEIDREAEDAMMAVAVAVEEQEKVGTVTLELKFSKQAGRIMVVAVVKPKAPLTPSEAALYFVGPNGLQKDDPRQFVFDGMKGLPDDAPAKAVDPETGEVQA